MNIFKRRIKALEARLLPNFITLRMADGSTHKIRGGIDLLHLFTEVEGDWYRLCCGKLGPPVPEEILEKYPVFKKIIDSVGSDENGHMLDLFKVLAAGPIPRGQSYEEFVKLRSAHDSGGEEHHE